MSDKPINEIDYKTMEKNKLIIFTLENVIEMLKRTNLRITSKYENLTDQQIVKLQGRY